MAETFEIHVTMPKSLDADLTRDLTDAGAADIEIVPERPGIAPLVAIAVAAVIGAGGLSALIMRWRDKHLCQQIIDTRQAEVDIRLNCDVKDGRIILISSNGDKVEIVEAPSDLDLTEILKAAVAGEDVEKAADEAGASVARG